MQLHRKAITQKKNSKKKREYINNIPNIKGIGEKKKKKSNKKKKKY